MSDDPTTTGEPHRARVLLHTDHRVGLIDENIFGGFLEHMGRAVYEGVFDPGNPHSDENGFRRDVLEALRPLRFPVVRYPGGNFVSAYDWRDGVGPVADRPRRPDFAWRSIDTNRFGTDEFMAWSSELGSEPMLAVNLGTGTAQQAAALVEYCNLPVGTQLADQRAANGHPEPYGVRLWCLGNETDGPWQAGHVPAVTYAERAMVASQLMKGFDPSIQTVACGSSARAMPTYLEWDRVVLDQCWEAVDFISAHRYSRNDADDAASFLAEGVVLDDIIGAYRGLLTYLKAAKRSRHHVHLSFDEWNVWYREMGMDGGWQEAPPILEEVYNVEDALVCAQYLNAFVRHADVVKVACLAQIVNVIAPVLTRPDGVLVQSIYWPFLMLRDAVAGISLRPVVAGPEMVTRRGDVPVIDAAASFDEETGRASVSLVSRDPARPVHVTVDLVDRAAVVRRARVLTGHPKEANTWEDPERVRLHPIDVATVGSTLEITLPAPAHAVIELELTPR